MGDDLRYIIPSPADATFSPVEDIPVELARSRRVQGRLFEKHILNMGPLIHPKTGARIEIDDQFVAALERNFANGVCDIVQVPLANDENKHVETPAVNLGEVVGLRQRDRKVYALVDARQDADRFGRTYLGASAFLSTNYTDSSTGKKVGPTLLHVAVTNRPYVTGLEDYKEVLATSDDSAGEVVVLTAAPEEPVTLTREELLAALKSEHGIDVEALQAAAAQPPPGLDQAALSAALVDALRTSGVVQLAAPDAQLTQDDVVAAVLELARDSKASRESIARLQTEAAEAEVDGYIAAGRVLPRQRSAYVTLALSDRDMLTALLPEEPVIKLNAQAGVDGPDGAQRQEADIDAEVARLTASHAQFFSPNGTKGR
jgi:Mu-like prophage I protein